MQFNLESNSVPSLNRLVVTYQSLINILLVLVKNLIFYTCKKNVSNYVLLTVTLLLNSVHAIRVYSHCNCVHWNLNALASLCRMYFCKCFQFFSVSCVLSDCTIQSKCAFRIFIMFSFRWTSLNRFCFKN